MKSKLLLLSFFVTAFTAIAKPVIIKGKIIGKLPEKLLYTAPVNGASGFDLYYTTKVDAAGNFEIKADINEVSFIDIHYNYLTAGHIIAVPGGQYSVIITEKDGKVASQITGTDAGLQKQYNILVPDFRVSLAHELGGEGSKIESPDDFKAFFDSKLQADIKALNAVSPKNMPIDDWLTVIHEREYFYATAMSLGIYFKHSNVKYHGGLPVPAAFDALWKDVYLKAAPDKALVQKLPLGYWFLMGYEFFKQNEAVGFDIKKIIDNNDLNTEQKRKKRLLYIPAQNAEYYLAVIQHNNVFEGQMEKYALDGYIDFKKTYPASSYTKYLEPEMAPLTAFFAQSGNLPQGAAYVDNYVNINSLEELIKKFPGKKLYIDVWATWCGPCRDEFKYKDALYKLLAANNITVVYISIDQDTRDEGWRKMIGHYGLQGYHIRTNKALASSVSHHFSGTESISIPWYILIGSKGEIAVKYAAPPSEMGKLEKEISKL
jgi:thiol-disulfide isomerase/thioredoxin